MNPYLKSLQATLGPYTTFAKGAAAPALVIAVLATMEPVIKIAAE